MDERHGSAPALEDPLWRALEAFELDAPGAALPFSARLARESHWPRSYARRAVLEYKRFLYLCVRAGHTCTPSDEVDQAWHLHLTYTRSYWEELCGRVLGRPLHHEPTRGGADDGHRYRALYEATLRSYARLFGEAPPADLWPPAEQRFGRDTRWVRVNLEDYELRPRRRRWWRAPTAALGALGAALFLPGCDPARLGDEVGGPFRLDGPNFLALGFALYVLLFALQLVARRAAGPTRVTLDPEDVHGAARLRAGRPRAVATAVQRLVEDGRLEWTRQRGFGWVLRQGATAAPMDEAELERAVFAAARAPIAPRRLTGHAGVRAALDELDADLERRGLLLRPSPLARALPAAWCAFLALELARLAQGIARERPVGYLVLLTIGTVLTIGLVALPALRRRPHPSVESKLRALGRRLSTEPEAATAEVPAAGMALALYGTGALESADPLLGTLVPLQRTAGSHAAAVGCGATGCGASGCGGGGCGGGGCGGCGS